MIVGGWLCNAILVTLLLFILRYTATDRIKRDFQYCFSLATRYTSNGRQTDSDAKKAAVGRSGPVCFRISEIPDDWDDKDLREVLSSIDKDLDLEQVNLSELFPACGSSESSQVALLNVDRCTPFLGGVMQNEEEHLSGRWGSQKYRLRIDKHFYDLTPLNKPKEPICADVIAVTGLGGHAFGSWRSRIQMKPARDRPMWLCDFLPKRHPDVRVMTYGYDSSLINPNQMRMTDYRRHLAQCIGNARGKCANRPLILIGHSLGGLLIIQTLLEWSSESELHDLRDNIRGILLFGTPHGGLHTADLEEMLKDGTGATKLQTLQHQLKEGSEYLENQKEALSKVWNDFRFKTVSFYEMEGTPTIAKNVSRFFKKTGVPVQRVKPANGQLYLPKEERFAINKSHTDMVKFSVMSDQHFQTVADRMTTWLDSEFETRRVVQTLATALLRSDRFFLNQSGLVIESHTDDDKIFPQILQDLDYENWRNYSSREFPILVYRELPPLTATKAAWEISRSQPQNPSELRLYSFRDSLSEERDPTHPWRSCKMQTTDTQDLFTLGNLLKQVLDKTEDDEHRLELVEVFIGKLYRSVINHSERRQISAAPDEVGVLNLMSSCTIETLWLAFKCVLLRAHELEKASVRNQEACGSMFALILDLNNIEIEDWLSLINVLRRVFEPRMSGGSYSWAKLLIVNPPRRGELELGGPHEILVEWGEERKACLSSLYVENSRYGNITPGYQHTFEWLWKSKEYLAWKEWEESSPSMLHVQGKPGSGKSTIVRYYKDRVSKSHHDVTIVSFFYSHRGGKHEQSHETMLRSILYQLLSKDSTLFGNVFQREYREKVCQTSGSSPSVEGKSTVRWTMESLRRLLRWACTEHQSQRKIILVLDALDESDPDSSGRKQIFDFLRSLTITDKGATPEGSLVKILIGTRPIPHIPSPSVCHSIVLQDRNKGDIEIYAHGLLGEPVFDKHQQVKQAIKDYIVKHSDGVFLWVRLVLEELQDCASNAYSDADMLRMLKALPTDLEDFYVLMLEDLDKHIKPTLREASKRILQFCLFGPRPIALTELRDALGISGNAEEPDPLPFEWELERPGLDMERFVSSCLGNFVDVKGGIDSDQPPELSLALRKLLASPGATRAVSAVEEDRDYRESHVSFPIVQVMHQTVFDYFKEPHSSVAETSFNATRSHGQESLDCIFLTCLRYLKLYLTETAEFQKRFDDWDEEEQKAFCNYINTRPFLTYANEFLKANKSSLPLRISLEYQCLVDSANDSEGPSKRLVPALSQGDLGSDGDCVGWESLVVLAAGERLSVAVDILLETGGVWNTAWPTEDEAYKSLSRAVKSRDKMTAMSLSKKWAVDPDGDGDGQSPIKFLIDNEDDEILQSVVTMRWVFSWDRRCDLAEVPTPLHYAAKVGNVSATAFLIKAGLRVDNVDKDTCSPLHYAIKGSHIDVFDLLWENGAHLLGRPDSVEYDDAPFTTPAGAALTQDHKLFAELFVHRKCFQPINEWVAPLFLDVVENAMDVEIEFLLDCGVDVQIKTGDYTFWGHSTALHIAAAKGHVSTVSILLDHGAPPGSICNDSGFEDRCGSGCTPLHFAARAGRGSVVELLLRRKADIHAVSEGLQQTPLHYACLAVEPGLPYNGSPLQLLLDNGAHADMYFKDVNGDNPLDLLRKSGYQPAYQFVQELIVAASRATTPPDVQIQPPAPVVSRFHLDLPVSSQGIIPPEGLGPFDIQQLPELKLPDLQTVTSSGTDILPGIETLFSLVEERICERGVTPPELHHINITNICTTASQT